MKNVSLVETAYLGDIPVVVLKHTVAAGVTSVQVYYVYADQIATPRVITRATDNQIVCRWDTAYPFGMIQPDVNPSGLGSFTYNQRFPGQMYDSETNLHYNNYRDYDPQLGRYIQSDPIGLSGGVNTYGYVEANPLISVGILGLISSYGIPDIYNTARYAPVTLDPCGCAAKAVGLDAVTGMSLALGGQPLTSKRFVTPGSSPGTSPISKGLSKALPQRLPISVPAPTVSNPLAKSNILGRVLGRWAPIVVSSGCKLIHSSD